LGEDEIRGEELSRIFQAINSDNDAEMLEGYLSARNFWLEDVRYDRSEISIIDTIYDNTNIVQTPPDYIEFNDMYNSEVVSTFMAYNINKECVIQEFNSKCENCNKEECNVINCFIEHIFSNYDLRKK
jgi:hypothetical protein